MKLKPVLAVLLLIGVLGFFFLSDWGRPLLGPIGDGLGGLTGGLGGLVIPQKQATGGFEIVVTTPASTLYGQKYKISGAEIFLTGTYNYLKVGDQVFASKLGNSITVNMKEVGGNVEFISDGAVKVTGTSTYVEIGDLIASGDKAMKVEVEILPDTAIVSDFAQSKLTFASITGRLDRYMGETYDSVSLNGGKLEVSNFLGVVKIQGTDATITGTTTSAKGDNFSFV